MYVHVEYIMYYYVIFGILVCPSWPQESNLIKLPPARMHFEDVADAKLLM